MCQQIGKLSSGHRTGKGKFSFQSQKGQLQRIFKLLYIELMSHASKEMLKILQARLQQYVNCEFQVFKLDLEKAEEPEIKLSTSVGSSKKQESSRKTYFSFIDYTKAFDCVDHNKLENSSRNGNTRPPDLPPEKPVYRSRSNSSNWT